jgi:Protein of unknown function (DUF3987)
VNDNPAGIITMPAVLNTSTGFTQMDFSKFQIEQIARACIGEPNKILSKGNELRYGKNGSMSVNLIKGTFFDHEAGAGGGMLDLVKSTQGIADNGQAVTWLEARGLKDRNPGQASCDAADAPTVSRFKGVALKKASAVNDAQFRVVKTWPYVDETGAELFEVCRLENGLPNGGGKMQKKYMQRHKVAQGYVNSVEGVRQVPYRLPNLLAAVSQEKTVFICEGEKACDAAVALGAVATCNAMGAGKFPDALVPHFAGADVIILPDNDDPGRKHAELVLSKLNGTAKRVRVLALPDLPHKGDVADWVDAGGTLDKLFDLAAGATHVVAFDWPEPKPVPTNLLPVAAFHLEFLPKRIQPWVADIAERMSCPLEYVAIPAVVAMASVLGRKISVRPQRKTDWYEVPNLWGCIVGRPGSLKSPAMNEALKFINRLEMDARKQNETALKDFEFEKELHKLKKEVAASRAKAALKDGGDTGGMLNIDEPQEPKSRRYILNDATYEALGVVLANNPHGILAFRDEIVSLLKWLDREEQAPARGFFLTGWSGMSGYTFDRIIRGQTHIEAVCVSLLGSTQPGLLADYIHKANSGGTGDDGLIQRFSLLVWPDQTPEWKEVDRYADVDARDAAWSVFQQLNTLDPMAAGARSDAYGAVPYLQFDASAQGIFSDWYSELETTRLRIDDMSPALQSHIAKYRKLVPALALINHLAEGTCGPISEVAVMRALEFAEYLESHAARAYGASTNTASAAASAIARRIRGRALQDGFTARDIHRHCWSSLTDTKEIETGLELLAELGWVRPSTKNHPAGGRPTTTYAINPQAL